MIGTGVKYIGHQAFAACENLETVTCGAMTVPSTDLTAFNGSYANYATLIVPEFAIANYKTTAPWREFGTFKVLESGSEPGTNKCAKPSIAYENGKLYYSTATPNAEVVSEIKVADAKKSYDKEVALTASYEITAYATKSGYDNSDVTTATLVWAAATLNSETSGAKEIAIDAVPLLISQNEGVVTVSGLDDGSVIKAYSVDGALVDQAKITNNSANLDLSAKQGEVIIMHVGDKSAKILVK